MLKTLFAGVLLFTTVSPTVVAAHPAVGEKRTIKQCLKLDRKALRKSCRRCLRKEGHHFHPNRKPAKRCMPNDSKKSK